MRTLLPACAAALILTGCQSPEEKVIARAQKWSAACGHPVDENGMVSVTEDESRALGECIRRLEQSYQAERSQNIAKSAALLGYSSTLMAPAAPAVPSRRTCNTTVQPSGRAATTTCY
jgi:hypothetical protein